MIAIPKWNASVNATGKDIIEGSDEVISIKVTPVDATGIALVDVNGIGYYVNLTGGAATLTVKDLKEGTYTVNVIYYGDDRYNNATATAAFNVSEAIVIETNATANETDLVVDIPKDAIGGKMTVIIDGDVYDVRDVTADQVTIPLDNLTPGIHNVTVRYDDEKGTVTEVNSTITVDRYLAPISVSVDNSTDGMVTVTVDVPGDATGYVIVDVNGDEYAINLTAGEKSATIPIAVSGDYTANVAYIGDDMYRSNSTSQDFHATVSHASNVTAEVRDTPVGEDVEVKVTVPVTSGENVIRDPGIGEGTHEVVVNYTDDSTGTTKTIVKTIDVFNSIIAEKELSRGWNSPYDYKAEFLDEDGHVLADTDVQFVINGKTYTVKTDSQGIAYLDANLGVGNYDVEIINPVTGARTTATTTIVKRLVENKDITMDFADGRSFVVRAIGDDGKPVGAGEIVKVSANGVDYALETDSNGYARLIIKLNPTTYKITSKYANYKVYNKLVVKQTLKLVKKTVKVKKSAKKLVIKAKLKWSSGKPIKGKKLVLKFKGKNYKAKTNKKGIAKFTVKKKVLKKLKKGKKYTYSVKYISNTVKGKVKVKK